MRVSSAPRIAIPVGPRRRWRGWAALAVAGLLALAGCTGSAADPDDAADDELCARVEVLGDDLAALDEVPDDLEELTDARETLDSLVGHARAIEEVAPDEVAEPTSDLVAATVTLATELRDLYQQLIDDPDRATDRELLREFQPLSEERLDEIERASAALSPVLERTCGNGEEAPAPPSPGASEPAP